MRDDAVGAERLEESKRRKDETAPESDVVMRQSSRSSGASVGSGEMHASRGTRRTARDAGLPSLQDLAESRPVQSAHSEMMQLGKLSFEKCFAQGDFQQCAACSTCSLRLFMSQVLDDIASIPQWPKSAVTRLQL